jgi:hypothetical protein
MAPTNNTSETGQDLYALSENEAPQLTTHGELPDLEQPTSGGEIYPNAELTAVAFESHKVEKALKACRKDKDNKKRLSCERSAKAKHGSKPKGKE